MIEKYILVKISELFDIFFYKNVMSKYIQHKTKNKTIIFNIWNIFELKVQGHFYVLKFIFTQILACTFNMYIWVSFFVSVHISFVLWFKKFLFQSCTLFSLHEERTTLFVAFLYFISFFTGKQKSNCFCLIVLPEETFVFKCIIPSFLF